MMKNLSKEDVADLPAWIKSGYAKAGKAILVLDGSDNGKVTISDMLGSARTHLTDKNEETVNVIVSDTFRFDINDPMLEALVKADPELEARIVRARSGEITGFKDNVEIGRFIQSAIKYFLNSVEGISTAKSARYTNIGDVLNSDVVSPASLYQGEDKPQISISKTARPLYDSFVMGTGGGDCAGLNDLIALLAARLASCETPASLYGVLDAFDGMSRTPTGFKTARVLIDGEQAARIFGTSSTALRSSRKNIFALDKKTGELEDPDSLKRMVKNLTGYTVMYTGNKVDGYMGIVLDPEAAQPEFSKFRGAIITGGNDHMEEAEKLFQLMKKLKIRNKSGKIFQVIVVPKSIDNDAMTEMLGFSSAAKLATATFKACAKKALEEGKILVAEVMGRAAGWLAVEAAKETHNKIVLVPEKYASIGAIAERVNAIIGKTGKCRQYQSRKE